MQAFNKINAEKTQDFLPFDKLIANLQAGFAKGCMTPTRHQHSIEKNDQANPTLILMPAWTHQQDEEQYIGVKIVNVFPDNFKKNISGLHASYILYDGNTGEELVILDGDTITGRRTAATSALAVAFLAKKDAKKLALIGAGHIAKLVPAAHKAVRPIEDVAVWNRNEKNGQALVESLQQQGFKASFAKTVEEAVEDADIVSAATIATTPIVKGEWIKKGCHIDLIGSFNKDTRESDDCLIAKGKIYIDNPVAILESGDLTRPIEQGIITEKAILGTLAQLCRGEVQASYDANTITIFKNVGSALGDLYAAKLVYNQLAC